MITIHEKNSTAFDTLGLGALFPSLCTVKEELNGLYELEMEHPYDEWGKWKHIEKERIIYASTPRGKQPFRIYYVNPTMEGITVNARHIFYDLLDNLCLSVNATGTPQVVLNAITGALAYTVPFVFSTVMTGTGTVNLSKKNPITALLDSSDDTTSFIKAFGGEILRDGFNVTMATSIGADRGVAIRYGKNLVGLEVTEDISDVATRILPIGKDGLQGSYVDSQYINNYAHPKIYVMEDSQLTTQSELQQAAQALLDGGADLPKVNIKADFQELSKTVEYTSYAILEEVFLGDVVTVTNSKMDFSKKAKVISYEWDCLLERYSGVELGDFVADLTVSVTSGEKSLVTATYASVEVQQLRAMVDEIVALGIPSEDTNTTYNVVTDTTDGLMSSVNKIKLDGIETEANKTVILDSVISTNIDTAASSNSVKVAYDKANHEHPYAPLIHIHTKDQIIDFPTIPTDSSELTKSDVYTKTQIHNLMNAGFIAVGFPNLFIGENGVLYTIHDVDADIYNGGGVVGFVEYEVSDNF